MQSVASASLGTDLRLNLIISGALEFLREQPAETFDLLFADALPGKYEGLEDALAVVKPGGFCVIDDMLPQPNWPEGHAAKVPLLMQQLAANPNFEILPLLWATGVVVASRKRSAL